jgi:hypothetical protein
MRSQLAHVLPLIPSIKASIMSMPVLPVNAKKSGFQKVCAEEIV